MTRDNNWLMGMLDEVWDQHFGDVNQDNIVRIQFGRRTKNRLGSIKLDTQDRQVSLITINGLFRDPAIPEFVTKATIVHELSHYAHGFNSPLEQKYRHPHAGGVMRAEFEERGLGPLYKQQRAWLKEHWPGVVAANFAPRARRPRSRGVAKVPKPFWFIG